MDSILKKEVEMIRKTLNENMDENIEDYKYFHIGEFIEKPNQLGCLKRNQKWYLYEIDEKNYCTFSGPFCLRGVIYACSKLLHVSKKFKEYRFSDEELQVYINNNFHSFSEIDKNIEEYE